MPRYSCPDLFLLTRSGFVPCSQDYILQGEKECFDSLSMPDKSKAGFSCDPRLSPLIIFSFVYQHTHKFAVYFFKRKKQYLGTGSFPAQNTRASRYQTVPVQ
jgi:hypothetical protein